MKITEHNKYDWNSAFEVSWRDAVEPAVPGSTVSLDRAIPESVKRTLHSVEGENDGDPWRLAAELHDGRFIYLEAWCDYTGWG